MHISAYMALGVAGVLRALPSPLASVGSQFLETIDLGRLLLPGEQCERTKKFGSRDLACAQYHTLRRGGLGRHTI